MRRFNPEKELKKIQHGNRNKILYGIILLLLIISIGSTYALYQVRYSKRIIYTKVAPFSSKDIDILAVYLDNQPATDFPEKNSGYRYDKIVCDNSSTATFDNINWELVLRAKKKDKCSVYFVKTYKDPSGANAPELYQGLIPVIYGDNGKIIVANIEDKDTLWYNYGEQKWANAVLVSSANYNKYVEGGKYKSDVEIPMTEILQMYVWIPRYKYQLFNAENGNSIEPQEIQIQFEHNTISSGDTTCTISDKGLESCNNAANGKWYTHPAFKFGNTDLTGIWVGKFESSGNANALTIKPNISSWRLINVKTMFNATRAIEDTYATNFNLNPEEIDTHMMKNMEWGAMAYLTHSKYGQCDDAGNCDEVAMNTNSSHITGYSGTANTWNTITGQLASTTGNLYGIYDTNGGSWEYVMSVTMIDNTGSGIHYSSSGFSATDLQGKEKYYDLYEYDTVETSHRRGHLGDATRETLKTFGNNIGGWYDDIAYFPYGTSSWFGRGGFYNNGTHAGTFAFVRDTGGADGDKSFRVVLSHADNSTLYYGKN